MTFAATRSPGASATSVASAERVPPLGRRPLHDRVRDAVVGLAGLAGLATLAWLVASTALSFGLVVIVTGSMTPAMPAGSAVVTRTVPAAELVVGDAVTIPRPHPQLPVTHRIVSIGAVDGRPDARVLTLRGDANGFDDRARPVVEEAAVAIAAVPHLGHVLAEARDPATMRALGVLVGVIVAWAFWPTRPGPFDPLR